MVGFDSRWVNSCDSPRARARARSCGGGMDHCHGASRMACLTVATSMAEVVWEQIATRVWLGGRVVWRKGAVLNVVDP